MMKRTMAITIVDKEDPKDTRSFWPQKSSEERISTVEFLKEQFYSIQGEDNGYLFTFSQRGMGGDFNSHNLKEQLKGYHWFQSRKHRCYRWCQEWPVLQKFRRYMHHIQVS
jgi:hypothetical protein